jgi:hypothetical protein
MSMSRRRGQHGRRRRPDAARMVELEDGDSSSDAGYQAAHKGDNEVLTNRRLDGDLEHGAPSGPCSARLILN